jgi:prolyl oligopeptidase
MRLTRLSILTLTVVTVPLAWSRLKGRGARQQPTSPAADTIDAFRWLEDVESPRSLAWVRAQDSTTMKALGTDPHYGPLYDRSLEILDSHDRIVYPEIMGDEIYNFWQDADHPRGIWRRTSWDDYLGGQPQWQTVLDIDSLSRAEKTHWAWKGADCLPPQDRDCLVSLSRGGADAVQVREFDAGSGRFVDGGFTLPEAKQDVAWLDADHLLVDTDFGPGSMTTSGYGRIAKLWTRGTPLSAAHTLLEGDTTDVGVGVFAVHTPGHTYGLVSRSPVFFHRIVYLLQADSLVRLDLPLDADADFVGDRLVVYLRSPWTIGGRTFQAGALVAAGLDDFLAGKRDFQLVLQPGPRATIDGTTATRDYLLVNMLDEVRPKLLRYAYHAGAWSADTIPVPDFGSAGVVATSRATNRFFFGFNGFTQPTTLYVADEAGAIHKVRQLPAMFDAAGLVSEQHEATSKDGTKVPYFVVHRRDLKLDGTNPTLLYGYGGFELSMTPSYNPLNGADWLARGGVYVLANIRGGGEFGPRWHRAAMKEYRQRAYDDFIAVGEDLIRRHITSPAHLGIMGGSNGGLLMGVMLTERPDLWNAVVILNPLLDMKRYSHLLAGASWMDEYGNPDIPADWAYISKYSPYQNIRRDAHYPRPFIYTDTRDDRVHPGHARKFAAKMEAMGHPVWFFENTEGGHGPGVTNTERAKSEALVYTYLWRRLAPRPHAPAGAPSR